MNLVANRTYTFGGMTFSFNRTLSVKGPVGREVALAAAKTGTLSTRTDNDTGEITGEASHGVTTGARLDVYWVNVDGTLGHRRGMTVGTVAGTAIPIDGGTGDNLPVAATAVTLQVPTSFDIDLVGNDCKAILFQCTKKGIMSITDNADAEHLGVHVAAGDIYDWLSGDPSAVNPIAGDTVGKVFLSNGDSAAAATGRFQFGMD